MNNSEGLKSFQQSLAGLPQWVSERILQQINQLTHYEPVIGIMGKSGAGKSSLCNALFASEVSPVSDVAACTREPLRFRLQVGERFMTLVDLPGVGESGARDTEYAALYREQLPRLDLVLWLIKADDRALAVDEHFYHQVIGEAYRHKVLFVISQSDIDIETGMWNIPAEFMKMKKPHKVPLSKEALRVLDLMKVISGHREWVFPSIKAPLNHMHEQTANAAIIRMGFGGELVAHGMRSIARTAAEESGKFRTDVLEAALAHSKKDEIIAAYNRAEYLTERVVLMQWWSDYVSSQKCKVIAA